MNIHQAKTHLSRLIERALEGEDVVIAKAGHPLVRITRLTAAKPELDSARGLVSFKPGWDSPLTDRQIKRIFGA